MRNTVGTGRDVPGSPTVSFYGVLDDLRIYNYGISGQTIEKIWSGELSGIVNISNWNNFIIFPNPSRGNVTIVVTAGDFSPDKIWVTGVAGNVLWRIEKFTQNN